MAKTSYFMMRWWWYLLWGRTSAGFTYRLDRL